MFHDNRHNKPARTLMIVALLGVLLVSASCAFLERTSSVEFPGRLLMTNVTRCRKRTCPAEPVYELQSGWREPVEVSSVDDQLQATRLAATSPDGRYAVIKPHDLQDRMSGETMPLPVDTANVGVDYWVQAAFSPDGEYLAYSVLASRLYVLHLASKKADRIYASPCAEYIGRGQVCGALGAPVWIDPDTLLFTHYAGVFPTVIHDPPEPGDPRHENRTTVMTKQGNEILSVAQLYGTCAVHGNTIFVGHSGYFHAWLERDDLLKGAHAPHPLPGGQIGATWLSPDGRYVVRPGRPWRLIELRTGQETTLGTSYEPVMPSCMWSPDQTSVACTGLSAIPPFKGILLIIPTSDEPGGIVWRWKPEDEWRLLDWIR